MPPTKPKFLVVALIVGIAGAVGLIRLLSGAHSLAASTVLAASTGPIPLLLLALVDGVVGAFWLICGASVLARKFWALRVLAQGSLAVIGYEVGRAIGTAVAWGDANRGTYDLVFEILFLFMMISVTALSRTRQAEEYLDSTLG